ncbi:MAG: CBS domain-containing protein [Desulfobacterales bacterium]|nr:CBS domain-containing protein [Desulfobacterales bacterium]
MQIKSLMILNPITVTAKASIKEAIELMQSHSIRHLPVVSAGNRLEGFVTLADLKQGLIPSMLADVSLSDLLIRNPIAVDPDDDIEIAARLIYKHKIGGMPVVKNDKVVGIITESDILRAFIDMMGILRAGSRIDVVLGEKSDALQKVLQIIQKQGVEIINVGQTAQQMDKKIYSFRLSACSIDSIRNALEKEGFEIIGAMD